MFCGYPFPCPLVVTNDQRAVIRTFLHGSNYCVVLEAFFIEAAPRLVERGHDVIVYCRKSLFQGTASTVQRRATDLSAQY